MTDQELIQALREHAEWARANEWECPITLGDDIYTAIQRLEQMPRWIPVTERLPEPETDVLAVCNRNGHIFVVPAIYEDGKMLTQDSIWNWCDIYTYGLYSEEADDYYVPSGWWENRQFNPDDVYNNPVDCPVTHWMPLPAAPGEEPR